MNSKRRCQQVAMAMMVVACVGLASADNASTPDGTTATADQDETSPLPEVKLSPRIRELPRDQAYYQQIPCTELDQAKATGDKEQRWLEARRRDCLNKVRKLAN